MYVYVCVCVYWGGGRGGGTYGEGERSLGGVGGGRREEGAKRGNAGRIPFAIDREDSSGRCEVRRIISDSRMRERERGLPPPFINKKPRLTRNIASAFSFHAGAVTSLRNDDITPSSDNHPVSSAANLARINERSCDPIGKPGSSAERRCAAER